MDIKEVKVTFRLTPSVAMKFKVKLAKKRQSAQSVLEQAVKEYIDKLARPHKNNQPS